MRFSTPFILALPVLGVSGEGVGDYVAKFQNFLGQFGASIPSISSQQPGPAKSASAKASPKTQPAKKIEVFTLDNWRDTLYSPVKADATKPEEWWVFVTGGNKTCWGRCAVPEAAWNETAAKLATLPDSPHLGYLNCEANPVLCNVWSAGPPSIWSFKMLPAPAKVDIHATRLSWNETTPKTIMDLYEAGSTSEKWRLNESVFHPFNGTLAEYGLSVPLAYVLWVFSVVPNWAMMLVVSFVSRTMMNRRMNINPQPRAGGAQGGAAPAAR